MLDSSHQKNNSHLIYIDTYAVYLIVDFILIVTSGAASVRLYFPTERIIKFGSVESSVVLFCC
jgi:hypothetical protein